MGTAKAVVKADATWKPTAAVAADMATPGINDIVESEMKGFKTVDVVSTPSSLFSSVVGMAEKIRRVKLADDNGGEDDDANAGGRSNRRTITGRTRWTIIVLPCRYYVF